MTHVMADTHSQDLSPGLEILSVSGLKMHFPIRQGILRSTVGYVYAVDGVSFQIQKGETLGLVGESGCGKSTIGRCILRLYRPTAGRIFLEGRDITDLTATELIPYRKRMQVIFQDPYSSLNPKLRVREIIGEALRVHGLCGPDQWQDRVKELMAAVGLHPDQMARYPHEFSGGQRQRIGIARCLALNPDLIIADEPVSALDVSIQAQVINLLDSLKEHFHLSYLVISHDLALVEHISDRIAVMYLGSIAEMTDVQRLFQNPKHPYTRALLDSVPIAKPGAKERRKRRRLLVGDIPSPIHPPSGCRFHTRCPKVTDDCKHMRPQLLEVEPQHWVACLHYQKG